MFLKKIKPYHLMLSSLLTLFGWFALGIVGLFLAFWTLLLWFSVWQRPYRFELFLLAALGLLGAVVMLPDKEWTNSNVYFLLAFIVVAGSPVFDLFVLLFRRVEDA